MNPKRQDLKKKSLQTKNKIVRKTSDHAKTTLTIYRRFMTITSYLKGNFIDIYLSMFINAKC